MYDTHLQENNAKWNRQSERDSGKIGEWRSLLGRDLFLSWKYVWTYTCVYFYLSFKPPLPSPSWLDAHQILSKILRNAAPCQSLHSKPCPCLAASLARLGRLMSADYSVVKFQNVRSMTEWSESDRASQAKAEHQDKKVFPNQVILEIRRLLT